MITMGVIKKIEDASGMLSPVQHEAAAFLSSQTACAVFGRRLGSPPRCRGPRGDEMEVLRGVS